MPPPREPGGGAPTSSQCRTRRARTRRTARRYAARLRAAKLGRNSDGHAACATRTRADRRLLARRQLPVGRPDLSLRQSAAARAADQGTHQAAAARPLGHDAGPQLHLRALQSAHQRARPRGLVRHRTRPRRPGDRRQRLSRRDLQRGLSQHRDRRSGDEAAVQAVLVSRRHSEPRRSRDARLDPRGRRTRLRAVARLRRGVRQSQPDRRLRRRRRRGGDRPGGDRLALEQIPQPQDRRRSAADPAPQRLQDRQSDRARPHPARRARPAHARLRLRAALRRGRRPDDDARADGGDARTGDRRHRRNPAGGAQRRRDLPPRLADDRAALAQGLDLPEGDRRQAMRRLLALAPGADGRDAREPGARAHSRAMDEELPAGRAVRRGRAPEARARRARAEGNAPHERQPARQRRRAVARSPLARLPRLRRRHAGAGRGDRGGDARDGPLSRRGDAAQSRSEQLPARQPRREQLQPLAGRARR